MAAGFVLRAIAGGVATDVQISDWFLIVAGVGSLFMVTGKRHAEQIELGDDARPRIAARSSEYSASYLSYVRAVASGVDDHGVLPVGVRERGDDRRRRPWFELSIVPFVLAILRYAHVIEQGRGGAPEEIVLSRPRAPGRSACCGS